MAEASKALFRDSALIEQGKGLLIADESFDLTDISAKANIRYLTNRKDIANQLDNIGFSGNLSDFELESAPDEIFDFVLFRLNKSKVLTNYLLEQIARTLKVGGSLIMTGNNQEGIKSVMKHAGNIGEVAELELLGKGLRYARITKKADYQLDLNGDEYRELLLLEDHELGREFASKPGIYGYKKIDEGSRFLVETLLQNPELVGGKLLDLGCGYGYLAGNLGDLSLVTDITATDANVAAVLLADHNFKTLGLNVEVTLDDCGESLEDRIFDTIICNPPFHQGFGTSQDLTVKFVENTKRLLRRRGKAYYVVNKFIGIEKVCYDNYVKCTELASNNHFKIVVLERIR